jgi:hypothetical protein
MGSLNLPGLGSFTVDDSFGKLSKAEQESIVEELRQNIAAKGVAADMQKDYSKMSAGQLAKETVSNVPSSAVRFGESVAQPILHPVQTVENLAAIGKGVMQKLGIVSGRDATQYADAVGKFLVDRYGSKDAILKTLVTDPVGIMADVSTVLSAGGSLAVRAPGLLGRVGEAAQTAGRVTNPLSAVVPAAKVAAEGLGITTGAGSEAIRTAAAAGAEGGEASKAFLEQMRGAAPAEEVVSDARAAVSNLRQQRGNIYRQEMASIGGDKTVLSFDDVDKAVTGTVKKFKGVNISPSVGAVYEKLRDYVTQWKSLDPAEYHTAEGFDALKQLVGDVRESTKYGTAERKAADDVYNAIKNTIVKQNPKYGEIMKGYQQASDQINEIEKTLSTNPKASIDTALRKITSALRDNVNTNYGKRKELVGFLARSGAKNLLQKIAGQALKAKAPRGLAGQLGVAGLGIESMQALLAASNPLLAAKIAAAAGLTSPRLVGEAAHLAGRASRLPFRGAGLTSRLVGGTVQPVGQ